MLLSSRCPDIVSKHSTITSGHRFKSCRVGSGRVRGYVGSGVINPEWPSSTSGLHM